jgi:hypothetical protein
MRDFLLVFALILAALALVPALAHALEMPGKMRLGKDAYFSAQTIYYPGFTLVGGAEPMAALVSLGLLTITPRGEPDFWLALCALLGFIAMQAVYWLFTHPVNKAWVAGEKLSGAGAGFFALGSGDAGGDWKALRRRWEISHLVRASLASASFLALTVSTL